MSRLSELLLAAACPAEEPLGSALLLPAFKLLLILLKASLKLLGGFAERDLMTSLRWVAAFRCPVSSNNHLCGTWPCSKVRN